MSGRTANPRRLSACATSSPSSSTSGDQSLDAARTSATQSCVRHRKRHDYFLKSKTRSLSLRAQAAGSAKGPRSCSPSVAPRLGATGPDRLKAVASRIVKAGGEAAYAKRDIRRRDDVTNLVNLACERYGKLDVLIDNAGIGPISPLDDHCEGVSSPIEITSARMPTWPA